MEPASAVAAVVAVAAAVAETAPENIALPASGSVGPVRQALQQQRPGSACRVPD